MGLMQWACFKGNRLLESVLVSLLIHVLVLLYADSGEEAWMAQGSPVSAPMQTTASTCCIDVRLVLPTPPTPTPIEPPTNAAAPKPLASTGSKNTSPADVPLLPVSKPLQHTVYFYDRDELNVFPVLQTPVHFDIESLPIDDVQLGYADIVIYIQHTGQVVQLEATFSSLSEPTLQLVYRALKKARFTPGRVLGDAVAAKIRWRVVVESASSFTMMN